MKLTPQQYTSKLLERFDQNRNEENAKAMTAYVRDLFPFYGIKKPERAALIKAQVEAHDLPKGELLKDVCRLLWKEREREAHHAAIDLMELQVKKLDSSFLTFFEELIPVNAWWDSIDTISPRLAGPMLQRFPELIKEYPDRWIESDNFWFQRSAILFQLKYRYQTNPDILFRYIKKVAHSDEFFLQKASGWALRQYSRYNPEAIRDFIDNNTLPKLTVREGGKYI